MFRQATPTPRAPCVLHQLHGPQGLGRVGNSSWNPMDSPRFCTSISGGWPWDFWTIHKKKMKPKSEVWKMIFLFSSVFFRFPAVNFQGCSLDLIPRAPNDKMLTSQEKQIFVACWGAMLWCIYHLNPPWKTSLPSQFWTQPNQHDLTLVASSHGKKLDWATSKKAGAHDVNKHTLPGNSGDHFGVVKTWWNGCSWPPGDEVRSLWTFWLNKKHPGDSKWPFDHPKGGHLTPEKGHLRQPALRCFYCHATVAALRKRSIASASNAEENVGVCFWFCVP